MVIPKDSEFMSQEQVLNAKGLRKNMKDTMGIK